ncbi:GntR family transcriptional regulator [Extibacter muris]|uniref:GntR family transcriptional regulator n=1 Tax=Extibacter muris TaxID=1796622 RepID=UPI001D08AF96|nr:GntR family transcriptional regulator [Extibacter muris]MCB6200472.1 GntR family transcriptional regulator [Extibacter muris]MCQ4663417.1 GntR family transcriptional regulator [Extibacter muris]MCQ4692841.1 GntR family transcriptional regulator [Extibacter muris]
MDQYMELQQVVYHILKTQIQIGIYRQGERLPTMEDACRLFQVSIRTIRTAYQNLQKDGCITISKRTGVKVKADYSPQDIERNIQIFFSGRRDALIDLSRSMRLLLGTAQWLGFQNASPELLDSMEALVKREDILPSHKMIQLLRQIYGTLHNDMLIRLVFQTLMFYQAPFMTFLDIPNKPTPQDNPLPQMIDLCRERKWDELRTTVDAFLDHLSDRLCRFYDSGVYMPSSKEQLSFRWSGYKKASQICYTLAMELLNGVARNTYPEGTYLPSAKKLAEEKQVSVITVRRALAVLNDIGAMRSVNGVGTQVRPLAEVTEHCDFSQPVVRGRLWDFAQSLQLLALSCKEVSRITVASLSPDGAVQFENRLLLLRHIGQDKLAVYGILELISHLAPYAAVRTVYTELYRQLLWGYALRGIDKVTEVSKACYHSCLDYFLDCLRRQDAGGFAAKMEDILFQELDVAIELLGRVGIQETAVLSLTCAVKEEE